jgi:hypothetical protein
LENRAKTWIYCPEDHPSGASSRSPTPAKTKLNQNAPDVGVVADQNGNLMVPDLEKQMK